LTQINPPTRRFGRIDPMSIRNLDPLFDPRSVAVFGASRRHESVGGIVLRNLRSAGFAGPVHAVNPNGGEIDGVATFASIAELPEVPDLAVICTPPETIPKLIAQLGAAGTRAAIVVTAGLGAALTQQMLDAAKPYLLRILGPNCIGLMSPRQKLNATFAQTDARAGELAFVTQSGALLTAMLDWANTRGIGFSRLVSLGERADVDLGDMLDYLASDPHTRAILLYVESIEAPRKFMSAARAAARNKPVIIVKAGRAGAGMHAAASHTGALAGSDIVIDAAIRRAGMLRVDTLQDLFMAAETLTHFRANRSETLTLMTNGGGAGVMAADAAGLSGVALTELSPDTLAKLDALLPPTWSHGNPIDIIGDAPIERYVGTLEALLDDASTGAVLFMHAPTAIVPSLQIAKACAPLAAREPRRVMSCWLGDASVAEARQVFRDAGVAGYTTPEEAVRAFSMLTTYRRNQALLIEAPGNARTVNGAGPGADLVEARRLIAEVTASGREMMTEPEAKALLAACGVPVVATRVVGTSVDDALRAAESVGYPVALKILSTDISHKSDVGGVALDLANAEALRRAVLDMLARVRSSVPNAAIQGFTVQAMVRRPHAQELIIGTSIDAVFGPLILFGQGGTAVEVLADRALALPPLNRALARDLVSRTRVAKLLHGYRDHPPAQLEALYGVLIAVSQMLVDLPELLELDINPLLVDEAGAIALDARVRVNAAARGGEASFAIRPYPAQLEERCEWDGQPVVLRPIRPEDEAQHLAFLESLDANDIRLRVFYSRREIERTELARLTQIDFEREMAFIAEGTGPDGQPRTLGTVRAIADPDNLDAEFGIIVRSDLKGHGLGQLLLDKMIRYARSRGTKRLVASVLRENHKMLALAADNGFEFVESAEAEPSDMREIALVL
jgi:acetyltransferase